MFVFTRMRFSDFCDHKFLLRPAKQFHEVIRKIKFFPVFFENKYFVL